MAEQVIDYEAHRRSAHEWCEAADREAVNGDFAAAEAYAAIAGAHAAVAGMAAPIAVEVNH